MIPRITDANRAEILRIAERYGIFAVSVFGSVARGDAEEGSDLDLMVEMKLPSLMRLAGFKMDVEDVMGCRVDVVEPEAICHPILRERIFREAHPL